MVTKAYFTEQPDSIKYMPLPSSDTADLWMRKNIAEVTDPETGEVSYEADEAYMRTNISLSEIETDFEFWWEVAAFWSAEQPAEDEEEKEESRDAEKLAEIAGSMLDIVEKNVEKAIDAYTLELMEEGLL